MSRKMTKTQMQAFIELFDDYHAITCGEGDIKTPDDLRAYLADRAEWDSKLIEHATRGRRGKYPKSQKKLDVLKSHAVRLAHQYADQTLVYIREEANRRMADEIGETAYAPRVLVKLLPEDKIRSVQALAPWLKDLPPGNADRIKQRKTR